MTPQPAFECKECDLLVSQYESATFDLAKSAGVLDIASRMCDNEAAARATLEARVAAERQRNARSALMRHQESAHAVPGESRQSNLQASL